MDSPWPGVQVVSLSGPLPVLATQALRELLRSPEHTAVRVCLQACARVCARVWRRRGVPCCKEQVRASQALRGLYHSAARCVWSKAVPSQPPMQL